MNVFICHGYHDNDTVNLENVLYLGFESASLTLICNVSVHPQWIINRVQWWIGQ